MKQINNYILSITLLMGFFLSATLKAQHPSPPTMYIKPLENAFRFSGGGGGSFSGKGSPPSVSGLLGFDGNWNLDNKIAEGKQKINSLLFDMKFHPFVNTGLPSADSMDVRRFAIQDNDFRFQFGARFTHLKQREKDADNHARIFAQGFFDVIIVPFQIQNSVADNKGFTSLSFNMGGKFGVSTKLFGSCFGITANPQLNFLFLMDGDGSTAVEEATRLDIADLIATGTTAVKTARGYIAGGVKFEMPLNDFIITFELRKYFKMGQGAELEGLTNKVLFSVGTVTMGPIFGNGKKKEGKMKKKEK